MLQAIGVVGGLVAFIGYIPYVVDILRHKVKPQRVAFFIWFVLDAIAVFSQLAKGATNSLWLPSLEATGGLVIFLLSIRFGTGGFSKKDTISLIVAMLALVAWYFTKDPTVALYLVLLVFGTGIYLELHKAYKHPKTETYTAWVLASLGGMLTIFAVGSWNIILLSYPVLIAVANGAIVVAIWMGRHRKLRKK